MVRWGTVTVLIFVLGLLAVVILQQNRYREEAVAFESVLEGAGETADVLMLGTGWGEQVTIVDSKVIHDFVSLLSDRQWFRQDRELKVGSLYAVGLRQGDTHLCSILFSDGIWVNNSRYIARPEITANELHELFGRYVTVPK